MSDWIKHVKAVAKEKGIKYGDALKIASKSYKKKQKGGNSKLSDEVYKSKEKRTDRDGYKEDKSLSKEKSSVYVKDGKAVVAVRGTSDLRDIGTDALVALGVSKKGKRYKKEKQLVKEAIDKYGKDNVSVSGHSLGGTIARDLSRDLGVKAETYNSGASVRQLVEDIGDKIACKNRKNGKRCRKSKLVKSERTRADPVSLLGAVSSKSVKQKSRNPHALMNF